MVLPEGSPSQSTGPDSSALGQVTRSSGLQASFGLRRAQTSPGQKPRSREGRKLVPTGWPTAQVWSQAPRLQMSCDGCLVGSLSSQAWVSSPVTWDDDGGTQTTGLHKSKQLGTQKALHRGSAQ